MAFISGGRIIEAVNIIRRCIIETSQVAFLCKRKSLHNEKTPLGNTLARDAFFLGTTENRLINVKQTAIAVLTYAYSKEESSAAMVFRIKHLNSVTKEHFYGRKRWTGTVSAYFTAP